MLASFGTAQGEAVPTQPVVAWKFVPAGDGFPDFHGTALRDGELYAIDRQGWIHALDAKTGEPRWRTSTRRQCRGAHGLALSDEATDATLYLGCDQGLVAIDLANGRERWHTAIDAGVAAPACAGDLVIAASADGTAYGFRASDGTIVWKHDFLTDRPEDPEGFRGEQARFGGKPARPGAVTAADGLAVFSVFDQCRAVAVDATTGARRWAFRTRGWMYGMPAIGPRNVYVGSQDRHVYAVDRDTGKESWRLRTGARVEGSALPTERFVYVGSCDARLYAIDMVVGQVKWSFETEHDAGQGAPIYSQPLVIGDVVYLAAMSGKVYAVGRDDGALRWKLEPVEGAEPNSDLVTDGERLFLTVNPRQGEVGSAVVAITLPPG